MLYTVNFKIHHIVFTIRDIFKCLFNWNIYIITPSGYVITIYVFYRLYLNNNFFKSILWHTIQQIFSIVQHTVGEISHFEFDAFHVTRTRASYLKLFVGGVGLIVIYPSKLLNGTWQSSYCLNSSDVSPMDMGGIHHLLLLCSKTKHHDDVIKWKHFPRYWPFVRGIHRSPVNSPHKGQWSGALMFSLICAWVNGWVNNREAGDLRHYRAHYDVIVMQSADSRLAPNQWEISLQCNTVSHQFLWCVVYGMCRQAPGNWLDWSDVTWASWLFKSPAACSG